MMLRKRQREFVNNCNAALKLRKNTVGIAPTGAGKTIMLAAVALENKPDKLPSLILQHRDELVTQNRDKFISYAGATNIRRPMTIDAQNKTWDRAAGGWNFAMMQTLGNIIEAMPPLGFIGIDEAHHVPAPTYLKILAHAKKLNPDVIVYGTTATPNRGDKKALRTVFDNCGDQIQIGELIREGHLVRPRTFVLDIGIGEELKQVKRTAIDFDMKQVESIMNKQVLTDKIIEHWRGFTDPQSGQWISCADRQTIIFCSTIQHAADVNKAFQDHGISSEMIDGKLAIGTRRKILERYDRGDIQVLVNVSVLTEGFDHQPTSAVLLLRPSSWKSTMVQMIGRGLRKVDPELYPGVMKDDCIVLDFGTSCLTHGSLEDEPNLNGRGTKLCPDCDSTVPGSVRECPICGHEFPQLVMPPARSGGGGGEGSEAVQTALTNFVMTEIDILQDSPFKYESFWDGRVMLCFGFTYWACVVHYRDHRFYAIGAESNGENSNSFKLHCLGSSDSYLMALQSADDYMRTKGNKTDAKRVSGWIYEAPTMKQLEILAKGGDQALPMGMSKYRASCGIQFKFHQNQIRSVIERFIHDHEEKIKKYAHA